MKKAHEALFFAVDIDAHKSKKAQIAPIKADPIRTYTSILALPIGSSGGSGCFIIYSIKKRLDGRCWFLLTTFILISPLIFFIFRYFFKDFIHVFFVMTRNVDGGCIFFIIALRTAAEFITHCSPVDNHMH